MWHLHWSSLCIGEPYVYTGVHLRAAYECRTLFGLAIIHLRAAYECRALFGLAIYDVWRLMMHTSGDTQVQKYCYMYIYLGRYAEFAYEIWTIHKLMFQIGRYNFVIRA